MKTKIIIIIVVFFASCTEKKQNESIDLSNLQLTSIPDSIFTKTALVNLNLGAEFAIYPPLSALPEMQIDNNSSANHLKQLDDRIGNLTNLKYLNLCGNRLIKLPKSIIKLTNLEELDLSLNHELDVSKEIDKLKKMKNLKVLNIVETMNSGNVEIIKKPAAGGKAG